MDNIPHVHGGENMRVWAATGNYSGVWIDSENVEK